MLLFLLIRLEPSPGVRVTKVGASHPFLAHLEQVKDLVLERAALYQSQNNILKMSIVTFSAPGLVSKDSLAVIKLPILLMGK